jgi:hypothetical protein
MKNINTKSRNTNKMIIQQQTHKVENIFRDPIKIPIKQWNGYPKSGPGMQLAFKKQKIK